jgi:hypothetical protein
VPWHYPVRVARDASTTHTVFALLLAAASSVTTTVSPVGALASVRRTAGRIAIQDILPVGIYPVGSVWSLLWSGSELQEASARCLQTPRTSLLQPACRRWCSVERAAGGRQARARSARSHVDRHLPSATHSQPSPTSRSCSPLKQVVCRLSAPPSRFAARGAGARRTRSHARRGTH